MKEEEDGLNLILHEVYYVNFLRRDIPGLHFFLNNSSKGRVF